MITRDNLIREYHARRGSFSALLLVYLVLLGTLAATASAIV